MEFEEVEAAVTSLRLSGTDLCGRTLFVAAYVPSETDTSLSGGSALASVVMDRSEEISRTIYVGNVDQNATEAEIISIFAPIGPISAIKLAGDLTAPTRFAFLEFGEKQGKGHRTPDVFVLLNRD